MKIKSLVAAAAIALSSFGAFAGTSTFASGSATFTNDPLSTGSFNQTITFSGLANGLYDIVGSVIGQSLNFTSIGLDGASWDVTNFNGKKTKFGSGFLEVTAGKPLTLTLLGTAYSLSTPAYSGTITVTPVPEPETYGMLLAGLGLMGAVVRRRNKSDSDQA